MKLTIELVPKSAWFKNLRSEIPKDWDRLRKMVYKNAGYVCEICGGKGTKWPVECHEIWDYDDENKIQKLTGLIALCPDCHQVKHIGLAQIRGKMTAALNHLSKINNWSRREAEIYVTRAFQLWRKRNLFNWTIDIALIKTILNKDIENEDLGF